MRIATWNVNSLKARLEKVQWWLDRTMPDVVLLQETKLTDADVPHAALSSLGYTVVHHGEGRWNGVAIASREEPTDVIVGFGDAPSGEARMISAVVRGIRFVSLYAPNGQAIGAPAFEKKLIWYERLLRWVDERKSSAEPLVLGGDFNIAPDDRDVWDPRACHGGTHVSPEERVFYTRLVGGGFVDAYRQHHEGAERYTWWDYRAGDFYKNFGMRIDLLLLAPEVAKRSVASEIDREARKGKPTPSDHAPLTVDLDAPGKAFDAGWASASDRIAARRAKTKS